MQYKPNGQTTWQKLKREFEGLCSYWFEFALLWANTMEDLMARGQNLEEVIQDTLRLIKTKMDLPEDEIEGCANILMATWKHGDEFRSLWNRTHYGELAGL